ncbi:uncharacterized protein [Lepeophtheirus salmonis]|uniref:uncharacterized protein isoform X2 n=1 Tax=Lepeophtheirus salmonis TaxID=72036 RepID=UPI001AE7ED6B|nr:protein FAM184A-like isoform X2 [Lepeophtheirus salmonis]
MNSSEMCNGAPSVTNGGESTLHPHDTKTVSPEMLYKLSKKIAQLTKVIYSLNTRNDDLALDMENMREVYEDKISQAHEEIQKLLDPHHQPTTNGAAPNSSKPESLSSNETLRKELNKTKNTLKNMEAKMAEREEENRQMIESLNIRGEGSNHLTNGQSVSSTSSSTLNQEESNTLITTLNEKVNQLIKEKTDLIRKIDRKDVLNENLKLERESLQKELKELTGSVSSLNLELSAARVELSYKKNNTDDQEDNEFTDELIRRIEELTANKENLVSQLEESLIFQTTQGTQIEGQIQTISELTNGLDKEHKITEELNSELLRMQNERKENEIDSATIVERATKELATQYEMTLDDSKKFYEQEIIDIQESLRSSEDLVQDLKESSERMNQSIKTRDEEIDSLRSELSQIKAESEIAIREIKELTLAECQERLSETEKSAEERVNLLQLNMDQRIEELQTNLKEMTSTGEEVKLKLLESEGLGVAKENEYKERIQQLEEALEQALTEREEILLAAGDEIQNEKDIALEIEQRLMDDFEWKLREIEREHRHKLDELKIEGENQIRTANDAYNRTKDESFTKMSIDLHRNMEEKLKAERSSIKSNYEEQSIRDKEASFAKAKMEFEREKRTLENSFSEERTRLEREIRALKRKVDDFPNEISRATHSLKIEYENKEQEANRRLSRFQDKSKKDLEELQSSLNDELSRTSAEYKGKISELESRLRASDGHRVDSIFKVREDIEVEFSEKMETLRDMYLGEVENERMKVEELRSKLSESHDRIRSQSETNYTEIDELNAYIASREEEHETKINELLTRLQEQTTLAVRLQEEIDEYEWFVEDEEGNLTERNPNERPPSALKVRPPSTKPYDRNKGSSTLSLNKIESVRSTSSRLDLSEDEKEEEVPSLSSHSSKDISNHYNSIQTELVKEEEEEEYDMEDEREEEEVEPPPLQEFDPSSTQNTKRELSQPPALSKTSSASSVSYSSAASDNHQHHHQHVPQHSYPEKDLNKSSTQQIHHTTNQKKQGKRSHCAQQ